MASVSEEIIGIYTRHAEAFDQQRGRSLFERHWLDAFRGRVAGRGHILDIGCGSGEPIAQYFIGQGHAVTGVDSSVPLIEMCRARAPDQNWIVADMRQLRLGWRFDGIIAWDSFFHLTAADQRRMFPIIAAHAAPSAPLMFTSGPAAGEAIGAFEGETLYHASLDAREYEQLLAEAGFEVLDHVAEDPAAGGHTIWLATFSGAADTRQEEGPSSSP